MKHKLKSLPINPSTTVICGDWHQNTGYVKKLLAELSLYYVTDIIHVGDVGFMGKYRDEYVQFLDKLLTQYDINLYFIEGNHEDYNWLGTLPIDDNNLGHVTNRIKHLPRGSQYLIQDKHYTFIGGGVSVDQNIRIKDKDWWAEEEVTPTQLVQYKQLAKTDVLVTHDGPSSCTLPLPQTFFDPFLIHKSNLHRNILEEIREALQPSIIVFGHYHLPHSRKVDLDNKSVYFQALDCDGTVLEEGKQYRLLKDILTEGLN